MKTETLLPLGKLDPGLRAPDVPLDVTTIGEAAAQVEALGYDALVVEETKDDPYQLLAMAAVATTNAIESLNARFRRAVRHRGHFPNEQAALKVVYLVATAQRKNRSNLIGKTNGWKRILNTLTVH